MNLKKKKRSKAVKWILLGAMAYMLPILLLMMVAITLLNAPVPDMPVELLPQYKVYANLMDADWQLMAAYDLAVHNNQAEELDPEATAWFFLRVEYEGMNLSGKNRLLDYLGEPDFTFEEALNHLNALNSTYGTEVYKISSKSIVSLESTLSKEMFEWVEMIVSGNSLAGISGEANYSGANYGKLVLQNKGFFAVPLPAGTYTVSTRAFGYRIHPVYHIRKFHSGQDFPSPAGTPVGAAADGTAKVGFDPDGYGNFVKITHSNGFVSVYAHLLSVSVRNGASVGKGDCVGLVGSTGTSTGNHLHFEIRKDGQYLDPMKFIR